MSSSRVFWYYAIAERTTSFEEYWAFGSFFSACHYQAGRNAPSRGSVKQNLAPPPERGSAQIWQADESIADPKGHGPRTLRLFPAN
jgi:hypothetical protein